MNEGRWRLTSRLFFDERAAQLAGAPTLESLCYVSARDARLWANERLYQDLLASIVEQTSVTGESRVLEVGCASGFLAWGLSSRVGSYVGVDVAPHAIRAARKLMLNNAEFVVGDGASMRFRDNEFDAAVCYDVFTNFPEFESGSGLIVEMLRVVKPGGRVLVGSIPDATKRVEFERRVTEITRQLGSNNIRMSEVRLKLWRKLTEWPRRILREAEPYISCYYFKREDFVSLADRLRAEVIISDIHALNPYAGLRFNVVYTKSGQ